MSEMMLIILASEKWEDTDNIHWNEEYSTWGKFGEEKES